MKSEVQLLHFLVPEVLSIWFFFKSAVPLFYNFLLILRLGFYIFKHGKHSCFIISMFEIHYLNSLWVCFCYSLFLLFFFPVHLYLKSVVLWGAHQEREGGGYQTSSHPMWVPSFYFCFCCFTGSPKQLLSRSETPSGWKTSLNIGLNFCSSPFLGFWPNSLLSC